MHPGELLAGRFALKRLAGSGGMGAVYEARDLRTGEPVAIKVLHEGLSLANQERFASEATVLSELRHPAIVRYVAHGVSPSGRLYLAMEWLDGEDLGRRLGRTGLTPREAVALGIRVAEALGAAHERGIIHRDLKPSNVFLPGGSLAEAKLIDFGIARRSRLPRATQTGVILGTPGYMAPEQTRGRTEVDARADVFALGCTLFECLTGEPAFAGEDIRALFVKILIEEVPRVSELCPGVPPALDALVAQMLAKDPSDRPRDGAAVAAALVALDLGRPTPRVAEVTEESGLTLGEQRLLCVVLAEGEHRAPAGDLDATVAIDDASPQYDAVHEDAPLDTFASLEEISLLQDALRKAEQVCGSPLEVLTDGTVAATLKGAGAATDQAAQAARAALAMRELLPDRHIALATGRGEVASRLPVGEAIERAARMLRDAEGPPRIAIDEVTAGLLSPRFEVAGSEAGLELRGEREVLPGARTLLGRPTACVGRERELATLRAIFAECVAEPVARAALITAPAGVGKSRLASELVDQLRRRGEPLEIWIGHGSPMSAGSAFAVLSQVIRSAVGMLDGEPLAARQRKLRARVARHLADADAARVAEFLGEIAGVPFPDNERPELRAARRDAAAMEGQIRRAFEDLVSAECAATPLLLLLDDLHWGDLPTVRVVAHALRALRMQPLMVLALARPEVHERFPQLWGDRGLQEIRIAELTRRASEQLVRQALGERASAALVERLVEQADGHAFYLEELIRAAAEGKRAHLPETVVAMVQARLEALPPEARRVLRAASIFGDVFWEKSVAALLDDGAADVGGFLADLTEREMLVQHATSRLPGEAEYGFRQALIREGAYAMLTDKDRRLGHRLAGEWLERAGEADAMKLAAHFERGGARERAAAWYLRAGQQALRGGDLHEAIERAERGRACDPQGEHDVPLLLVLGEASLMLNDWAALERWVREMEARVVPGSRAFCLSLAAKLLAGLYLGKTEQVVAAISSLDQDITPEEDAAGALATAMGFASTVLRFAGQYELSERFFERMERFGGAVERDDAYARGDLSRFRAERARLRGELWTAIAHLDASRASFEAAGHLGQAQMSQSMAAFCYTFLGAHARAEEQLQRTQQQGERRLLTATSAGISRAEALAARGALEGALAELRAAADAERAAGNSFMEAHVHWHAANILRRSGDLAAAEREARHLLEQSIGTPFERCMGLAQLALIRVAQGRAAEAVTAIAEAIRYREIYRGPWLLDPITYLAVAEARLAAGDADGGRDAISTARDRLLAMAEDIADPGCRASFLERIPEHARVLDLTRRLLSPASAASEPGRDATSYLRDAEEALGEGAVDAAVARARKALPRGARGEVQALGVTAGLLRITGQRDAADKALADMERLARARVGVEPAAPGWVALAKAERARHDTGEPFQALRFAELAAAGLATLEAQAPPLLARVGAGIDHALLGAHAASEEALRGVLAKVHRRSYLGLLATLALASTLAARGAFGDARALIEGVPEAERARGNRYRAGLAATTLAEALLGLGEHAAAARAATSAIEHLSVAPLLGTVALATLATVRLREGRKAEALALARKARAEREALSAFGFKDAFVRLTHIEAMIAAGDLARARVPLARARHHLVATAAKIGDPALRRSFLEQVPENARTLELALRWLGEAA